MMQVGMHGANGVMMSGNGFGGASGGAVGFGGTGMGVGVGGAGVGGVGGMSGGVGGGAGACCGCVEACAGGTGPGVMTYVGLGGSYTTETTYKYVGAGRGEFELRGLARNNCGLIVCSLLALLLIVGVVVLLLLPAATSTTTFSISPVNPNAPKGDCLMWGDPHLQTFDKSFPDFYGEGEFWVVKSPSVHIQARYLATPFTNGLSATHQIAIGGPFMKGHKLSIGPLNNGQITCDGQVILQDFPSTAVDCGGVSRLTYNGFGQDVEDGNIALEKRIVHIDLDLGVHLQIMRWANHLNVRIRMPAIAGQDGACGNFNGNAQDDTTEQIQSRIGYRVPAADLIFQHQAQVYGTAHGRTIADCPLARRQEATALCQKAAPVPGGKLLDSCIFDVCFGGNQYAAEDGLTERQSR